MKIDYFITAIAGLVPLIIGYIWYNPKVFGNAWIKASGVNNSDSKGFKMPVIFGLTFILSTFIAIALHMVVIHQWSVFSTMMKDPSIFEKGTEINLAYADFMSKYGNYYRTFGHGVLHGAVNGGIFIAPVIVINAMFEKKSVNYILIHTGYWIVSIGIMGGIICKFANVVAYI
jgi:hypothetical protein